MGVVPFDPQERARELARGWRVLPMHVVRARCEALKTMQANGVRLPTDVYEVWLQMSAVLTVSRV